MAQHMQLHQQALQQRAQGLSPTAGGGGAGGGGDVQGNPGGTVAAAAGQVDSAVRSSAQTIGQKVSVDPDQN